MVDSDRRDELGALVSAFTSCEDGHGRVTVVKGTVATGKTTLLHAFADRLTGAHVLTATASRQERQIPLGVISQLLRRAQLAAPVRERADALIAEARRPDAGREAGEPVEHRLGALLLELADERPTMAGVDDAEYADMASLRCLQFTARRLDASRLHMVLSTDHKTPADFQWFETEIVRLPRFNRMRLTLLGPEEIEGILAPHLGREAARRLAPFCHRVSGGNLGLLNAIIEESHTWADDGTGEITLGPGGAYGQAVVDCLRRCPTEVAAVARAVAVLSGAAAVPLITGVVALDAATVAAALETLSLSGLADGLRHPAARAAVLDDLGPAERRSIHRRAAHALNAAGAPATAVADHLTAAGDQIEPWGVQVLVRAAQYEIDQGRSTAAVRHLELARELSTEPAEQARIIAMLTSAEWRISPATAARHLPQLVDLLRAGRLSGQETTTTIRYLLWYGRLDDAGDALERLVGSAGSADAHSAAELNLFRLWLTYSYPTLLERVPAARDALASEISAVTVATSPQLYAANLLRLLSANGSYDDIFDGAEYILHTCRLSDDNLDPLITSLSALVYVDRLDVAAQRCDALLAEAVARGVNTWQGELSLIRSVIALRAGDLAAAIEAAERALRVTDVESWGVRIGGPLATLIQAYTAMGDHRAAAAALRHRVPAEIFQTGIGLFYWQARGYHYVATGRLEAAASDFTACGELMTKWGLDLPGLVPWRTDLAQLYLRMGRTEQARVLIEEQLARVSRGRSRSRGVALRLLAAVSEPRRQLTLLRQSIEILEACGAQLELAHALDDLGRFHHAAGELDRARVVKRRSWYLLKWCSVVTTSAESQHGRRPVVADSEQSGAGEDQETERLSEAERRVVAWAARGLTNREIARKLYITVSTVEQHLTRAYRKLKVRRRTDLPTEAQLPLAETA